MSADGVGIALRSSYAGGSYANIFSVEQSGSDGFLYLRNANNAVNAKISGYYATDSYFALQGGKVGINNSTPGTNLSIGSGATGGYGGGVNLNRGSGVYNFYEVGDGTNTMIFGFDHTISNAKIGTINSYPIGFYTGNAEKARIDTGGNFLIGTPTSAGRLTVMTAETKGQNATPFTLTSNDSSNQFQLIIARATNSAYKIQSVEQGVSYRTLALQADGGMLGIGRTNPSYLIDGKEHHVETVFQIWVKKNSKRAVAPKLEPTLFRFVKKNQYVLLFCT
jgi:hypothetical protein